VERFQAAEAKKILHMLNAMPDESKYANILNMTQINPKTCKKHRESYNAKWILNV